MKTRRGTVVLLIAIAALACRDRESDWVTSSFGSSQISGQVVLVDDLAGGSPGGVEVGVPGTGLIVMTDAEGRFALYGLPGDEVEITFRRADGIESRLRTPGSIGSLGVVELSRRSASSRRRGAGHPGVEIQGTILSISGSEVKILDSHASEVTVLVDEFTILRHGRTLLLLADLAEGDQVHVKARRTTEDTLVAVEIKRSEGDAEDEGDPTVTANGKVLSVGTDHVMVLTANGREIRVNVDAETRIRRQGQAIELSDIQVGDRIEAQGKRVDDTTILATKIETEPGSNNGRGH